MKKNAFIMLIISLLILSSFSFSSANLLKSMGGTIYVDDDNTQGPWDGTQQHPFQDIQDAINAAFSGDVIYVYAGEYNIFQVDKSLTIQGVDVENTIINVTGESWINSDLLRFMV